MAKASREHTSEEFGQLPSSGMKGLDLPMIGAPTLITLDGIAEREAGVTPTPPLFPMWVLVVSLAVMVVVGLAILIIVPQVSPPPVLP
jgi:hypothetical protein